MCLHPSHGQTDPSRDPALPPPTQLNDDCEPASDQSRGSTRRSRANVGFQMICCWLPTSASGDNHLRLGEAESRPVPPAFFLPDKRFAQPCLTFSQSRNVSIFICAVNNCSHRSLTGQNLSTAARLPHVPAQSEEKCELSPINSHNIAQVDQVSGKFLLPPMLQAVS